ncbi:hypothetical protein [Streptomyces sp. NPDC017941]|uniref:hypothetical protein n=1 Tax=Streptomyces sp. NPDC017941 TaxID=3365018 RepID=UPI0037AB8D70
MTGHTHALQWVPLVYLTVRRRIGYLAPVRWQEQPLRLYPRLLGIRPAATEFEVRFGSQDRSPEEARILSVCWDTARERPRLLTGEQRRLLETYLHSEGRGRRTGLRRWGGGPLPRRSRTEAIPHRGDPAPRRSRMEAILTCWMQDRQVRPMLHGAWASCSALLKRRQY